MQPSTEEKTQKKDFFTQLIDHSINGLEEIITKEYEKEKKLTEAIDESLRIKIILLKHEIKESDQYYKEIADIGKKYAQAKAELADVQMQRCHQFDNSEKKIGELNRQISELEIKINAATTKIRKANRLFRQDINHQLKIIRNKKTKFKKISKKQKKVITLLTNKKLSLTKKLSEINQQQEKFNQYQTRITVTEKKINELNAKKLDLNQRNEGFEKKIKEIEASKKSLSVEITSYKKQECHLKQQNKKLEIEATQLRLKLDKQIKDTNNSLKELSSIIKIFSENDELKKQRISLTFFYHWTRHLIQNLPKGDSEIKTIEITHDIEKIQSEQKIIEAIKDIARFSADSHKKLMAQQTCQQIITQYLTHYYALDVATEEAIDRNIEESNITLNNPIITDNLPIYRVQLIHYQSALLYLARGRTCDIQLMLQHLTTASQTTVTEQKTTYDGGLTEAQIILATCYTYLGISTSDQSHQLMIQQLKQAAQNSNYPLQLSDTHPWPDDEKTGLTPVEFKITPPILTDSNTSDSLPSFQQPIRKDQLITPTDTKDETITSTDNKPTCDTTEPTPTPLVAQKLLESAFQFIPPTTVTLLKHAQKIPDPIDAPYPDNDTPDDAITEDGDAVTPHNINKTIISSCIRNQGLGQLLGKLEENYAELDKKLTQSKTKLLEEKEEQDDTRQQLNEQRMGQEAYLNELEQKAKGIGRKHMMQTEKNDRIIKAIAQKEKEQQETIKQLDEKNQSLRQQINIAQKKLIHDQSSTRALEAQINSLNYKLSFVEKQTTQLDCEEKQAHHRKEIANKALQQLIEERERLIKRIADEQKKQLELEATISQTKDRIQKLGIPEKPEKPVGFEMLLNSIFSPSSLPVPPGDFSRRPIYTSCSTATS